MAAKKRRILGTGLILALADRPTDHVHYPVVAAPESPTSALEVNADLSGTALRKLNRRQCVGDGLNCQLQSTKLQVGLDIPPALVVGFEVTNYS